MLVALNGCCSESIFGLGPELERLCSESLLFSCAAAPVLACVGGRGFGASGVKP